MRVFLSTLFSLSCAAAMAQDVHFSQFYEQTGLRNPALGGIYTGDYKVGVNYREQAAGFGVPYRTVVASAETKALVQPSTGDYLSFGLTAMYDKAGSINFTSTAAYGSVAYNKSMGDARHTYLSVGLCGGYIQRSVDMSKMRFANQYAGGSYSAGAGGDNIGQASMNHYDAAAGLSLSSSFGPGVNYYIGAAGYHLSRPKESYMGEDFIRLATRWTGSLGLVARLDKRITLEAHADYQQQAPYQEILAGGLLAYTLAPQEGGKPVAIAVGCFYRHGDAVIPTLRMAYNRWTLTTSYDVPLTYNRLYGSGLGGFELSLYGRGVYRHKQDVTACPRFELLEAEE